MSQIRKQSLKATGWIYFGFFIGAVNTYFLTHKNWFTPDENGLTRAMIDISQLIFAFSCLGTPSFIFKFFPYYQDNLTPRKNDILSIAVLISICGFIATLLGIYFLDDLIVQKFSANSILLVQYFYWVIPFGFLILLYNVFEAYSIGFNRGILTTLLRETILRLYTLVLILLKVFNFISYPLFIKLFAFQYAVILILLIIKLYTSGELWITLSFSRVTFKYRKKIIAMLGLTFMVIVVNMLRQSIDGLVLAAKQNLGKVGIFGFALYMASLMQAPFRSMVAVTIPLLSRAWKNNKLEEIQRIYQRSAINLLIFSLFVFIGIWLNLENAIQFFGINPVYLEGKWVFFILGIVTIIEMGTGLNAQIIATSVYWRFELWTSLLLTAMIIPLSYTLTVKYGIFGPAVANLVSFSVYNGIRYFFLLRKFKMQAFSIKTVEILIIAALSYFITATIFRNISGLPALFGTTIVHTIIFGSLLISRKISPDVMPIIDTVIKRLGIKFKQEQ